MVFIYMLQKYNNFSKFRKNTPNYPIFDANSDS